MSGPDLASTQSSEHVQQQDGPSRPTVVTGQQQQQQQQQQYTQYQQQLRMAESAPFQSQLGYLSHSHQQMPPNMAQHGQQSFDMSAMSSMLPQVARSYASPDLSQSNASPSHFQPSQQAMYPPHQRPQYADPAMMARVQQQQQQQQFMGGVHYGGPNPNQRQQVYPMQHQLPYSPIDPYGFGMSPMSPMGSGYGHQPPYMMPTGMPADFSQYTRRSSATDTAPIPSFPRGPPRKPKQSGHALWVGNLPPAAVVTDLKDHFARDATRDIESVFLIAKSNCAFVNYRTEAACIGAMNRFHDSRFHGVRLVCRLRRGTVPSSPMAALDDMPDSMPVAQPPAPGLDSADDAPSPTIARSQAEQDGVSIDSPDPASTGSTPEVDGKVPEKYFIVKSLTAQDLEASVRNGIWATQSHNENALNRAYEQAENVYLIFSANKSGEYFGYARMASLISGEPVNLSSVAAPEESTSEPSVSPQSIPTPATATAPKGRIIDDSARGTIFWEADHSEDEEGSPEKDGSSTGHNWGKQFSIEWLSTNRLPFYRTRGLRNPWNANREVKIARDGTELEPSVGRRLVQMFHHRPSPSQSQMSINAPLAGVPPYR